MAKPGQAKPEEEAEAKRTRPALLKQFAWMGLLFLKLMAVWLIIVPVVPGADHWLLTPPQCAPEENEEEPHLQRNKMRKKRKKKLEKKSVLRMKYTWVAVAVHVPAADPIPTTEPVFSPLRPQHLRSRRRQRWFRGRRKQFSWVRRPRIAVNLKQKRPSRDEVEDAREALRERLRRWKCTHLGTLHDEVQPKEVKVQRQKEEDQQDTEEDQQELEENMLLSTVTFIVSVSYIILFAVSTSLRVLHVLATQQWQHTLHQLWFGWLYALQAEQMTCLASEFCALTATAEPAGLPLLTALCFFARFVDPSIRLILIPLNCSVGSDHAEPVSKFLTVADQAEGKDTRLTVIIHVGVFTFANKKHFAALEPTDALPSPVVHIHGQYSGIIDDNDGTRFKIRDDGMFPSGPLKSRIELHRRMAKWCCKMGLPETDTPRVNCCPLTCLLGELLRRDLMEDQPEVRRPASNLVRQEWSEALLDLVGGSSTGDSPACPVNLTEDTDAVDKIAPWPAAASVAELHRYGARDDDIEDFLRDEKFEGVEYSQVVFHRPLKNKAREGIQVLFANPTGTHWVGLCLDWDHEMYAYVGTRLIPAQLVTWCERSNLVFTDFVDVSPKTPSQTGLECAAIVATFAKWFVARQRDMAGRDPASKEKLGPKFSQDCTALMAQWCEARKKRKREGSPPPPPHMDNAFPCPSCGTFIGEYRDVVEHSKSCDKLVGIGDCVSLANLTMANLDFQIKNPDVKCHTIVFAICMLPYFVDYPFSQRHPLADLAECVGSLPAADVCESPQVQNLLAELNSMLPSALKDMQCDPAEVAEHLLDRVCEGVRTKFFFHFKIVYECSGCQYQGHPEDELNKDVPGYVNRAAQQARTTSVCLNLRRSCSFSASLKLLFEPENDDPPLSPTPCCGERVGVKSTWSLTHVPDVLFFKVARHKIEANCTKLSKHFFHFPLTHSVAGVEIELYAALCREGSNVDEGHWRLWYRAPTVEQWAMYDKTMRPAKKHWWLQKNVLENVGVLIYRRVNSNSR